MNAIHRLVGKGGDHLVPELLGHDLAGADDAHTAALVTAAGRHAGPA